MKKIEKRKIVIFVILALCLVIFVSAFLILRSWFHSDGMHFIGKYGQVHMSQICEGFDQDGNKIEARNVIVDGVITMTESKELGEFSGTIDIDGLPEMDKLFPASLAMARKYDNGLYEISPCLFTDPSYLELDPSERYDENREWEDGDCSGTVWIKDNQAVMKFYVGDMATSEKYYIFYSDEEMLNIEELNYKQ